MLSPAKYAYANTRVRAIKSKELIPKEHLRKAEKFKSLEDLVALMETYGYKVNAPALDSIKNALISKLLEIQKIAFFVRNQKVRSFIQLFFRRYEVFALRWLLANNSRNKLFESLLSDEIKEKLESLYEAKTISDLKDAFSNTIYEKEIEKIEDGATNPRFEIFMALERSLLLSLWEKLSDLSKHDAEAAKKNIGLEIDVLNLISALKFDSNSRVNIEDCLIPIYFKIDEDKLLALAKAPVEEKTYILKETNYGKVVPDSKDLFLMEMELKRFLVRENERDFRSEMFSIATILSFLRLKESEINNLEALAISIENSLTQEEIRSLLTI